MRNVAKLVFSTAILGCVGFACAPASAKTASECNAEYAANKAALQTAKQKKADFIKACRAGTETIPGAPAAAATPATPAAAPAQTPAAAPAPKSTAAPATSAKPTATRSRSAPTTAAAPISATEAQAQAKCPGGLVVWVDTASKIYHFKGNRNYGNTKSGAYMCENEALNSGDRAAKNEKHP